MEVLVSPYELKKISGGIQEGALIKVVSDGMWGVADLCPHPRLGDSVWQDELKEEGLLFKRALQLANEDLMARKNKTSLLQNKNILNNYLVTDIFETDFSRKDFSGQTVKVKCGDRIEELAAKLNGIDGDIKLRLDFNAALKPAEFETFLSLLSEAIKKKIEYIEDPTVLSPEWRKWNALIPLASDWQKTTDRSFATFRIVKPSRENIPADLTNCTFTSAMDHAVGVAHGLRLAQLHSERTAGFLTLGLYEPTEFNKYFVVNGERINFSALALQDDGIGMTADLNKLHWVQQSQIL